MPWHPAPPDTLPSKSTLQPAPVSAQHVNREIVVLLGWAPAILMQLAHPLVAAGVADHSSFAKSPQTRLRRLTSTINSMLALTFGSPADATRAAGGINRIHDRVFGELREPGGIFPAGAAYSAHDPELLRWVHATMLDVLPRAYELYVGPLTEEEVDRYCRDASGIAPLLGIPDHFLPASSAELRGYLEAMLDDDEISVTPTARALAHELLSPPLPRPLRPLLRLTRLSTIGLLPARIRQAYGFRWDRHHQQALTTSATLTRRVLALAPSAVRHWPAARAANAQQSACPFSAA